VSPKQRLLADQNLAAAHRNLVDSALWQQTRDLALLAVIEAMPDVTDPSLALAAYHSTRGARDMLRVFEDLSALPKPKPTPPSTGLNYNA